MALVTARPTLRQGSWRSRTNRLPKKSGPQGLRTLLPFPLMARVSPKYVKGVWRGCGPRMRAPNLSLAGSSPGVVPRPFDPALPPRPPHLPSPASPSSSPAPAWLVSLVGEISASRPHASFTFAACIPWVGNDGSSFPPQSRLNHAGICSTVPQFQVLVSPRGLGKVCGWGLLTLGLQSACSQRPRR